MAATLRLLFPKNSSFTWHRPGAFDRAYGQTWAQGIDAHLPDCAEINAALQYIVEHPEVEPAWAEYCHDFLLAPRHPGNKMAAFPMFHKVKAFVDFLLEHETLKDFLNLGGADDDGKPTRKLDKSQWDQRAHIAAFILGLMRQRMLDEKMYKLNKWGTGHHWCAAHVLWELLHWKHTEWQRQDIAKHEGTTNPPTSDMYVAVAPGVGLQSYAPRSAWANMKAILFRTV